jgi:glycosyltransferase involved in cell wall biosynthesis
VSHVALLIPTLDRIGGAERQVMLLAEGLVLRGWRVSVVALSGTGGSAAAELTASGAGFLSLEMRKGLADPRGWIRFHSWLRQETPDLLHAHLHHAAWLSRWSRIGAPVRVVVDTLHSSHTGSLGRQLGYRWSSWLADRTTAVSNAVAEAHLSSAMARENKLTVLPNGVDVQAWRPDHAVRANFRRELGLGDEFLWLAAGRLEPVKDYATLLWAMAPMPDTARLAIAGSGSMLTELTQLATRLGMDRRVSFLGFQPDLRRWMHAADGFVLSSRWEGLPMGLLEAAACALPAVATDVPGTREVIVHCQTGLLTTPGSAVALEGAMTRMMQTSAEERRAMGERARQRVIGRYSLESVLGRWEALYAELLGNHPTPLRRGRTR